MNTSKVFLTAVAAGFISFPAIAQDTQESDAAAAEAGSPQGTAVKAAEERDDEKVVCRELAPRVGTRVPGRNVCLTVYQWEQWAETTRDEMRDIERRGLTRNTPG